MQGNLAGHKLNKNEMFLKRTQRSSDHVRSTVVVAIYTFGTSFSNHVMHFEGEEVLQFGKRPIDCPFGVDNDSHRLDCVNVFRP